LIPEKRDHEDHKDKINRQKPMGQFKLHPEKRGRTLAVAVQIVHYSHDQGQGKDGVQSDGKKVVQFSPL